jgi:hypothetical protein
MIDPALITEMYSDRPWLYSPMLCSMNIVNVVKAEQPITGAAAELSGTEPPLYANGPETSVALPKIKTDVAAGKSAIDPEKVVGQWVWGGEKELMENNELLLPDQTDHLPFPNDGIAERRRHFNHKNNREGMIFKPDYVYNLEVSSFSFIWASLD